MKNKLTTSIIVVLVIAGISFYGGMTYGKGQSKNAPGFGNSSGQFQGQNRTGGTRSGPQNVGFRGGGFVEGDIVTIDAKSLTIKLQDGSSKIVLISTSTPITKSINGSMDEVVTNTHIFVTGMTNSDGSISARSIDIRERR